MGKIRWAGTSGKTVEGSIAFFLSVMLASLAMWAMGLVDDLHVSRLIDYIEKGPNTSQRVMGSRLS